MLKNLRISIKDIKRIKSISLICAGNLYDTILIKDFLAPLQILLNTKENKKYKDLTSAILINLNILPMDIINYIISYISGDDTLIPLSSFIKGYYICKEYNPPDFIKFTLNDKNNSIPIKISLDEYNCIMNTKPYIIRQIRSSFTEPIPPPLYGITHIGINTEYTEELWMVIYNLPIDICIKLREVYRYQTTRVFDFHQFANQNITRSVCAVSLYTNKMEILKPDAWMYIESNIIIGDGLHHHWFRI